MTDPNDAADDRRAWLVRDFERNRPYLRSVAYRMLGSLSDADDAIQEGWLRLDRRTPDEATDLRPWLTTVVSRICLDMLRARRTRREGHTDSWLPEPVVGVLEAEPPSSPEDETLMADSIGLAMLVVLERLSPAERLAFVLHDVFGLPFEEIAPIVDRSPAATRQLASRARRRVRGSAVKQDSDLAVGQRVVDAFLRATREGDFGALLALLDPGVVLRLDGGGRSTTRPPVTGAHQVAAFLQSGARPFAPYGRQAVVNGAPGALVVRDGQVIGVVGITVSGGRISEIDIVADPAKLQRIQTDDERALGPPRP